MINAAMKIINVYERNPEELISFFDKSNQTYSDVLTFYNYLIYELSEVDKSFQEREYQKQIQNSFSIIPKHVETVIPKELVFEMLEMTEDFEITDPKEFMQITNDIVVTGYKFQLKYFIRVFEELLQSPIWEKYDLGIANEE